MRAAWCILFVSCLAVAQAPAAETGRKADFHLHDGTTLRCLVLGYADGKFLIEESGTPRQLDVATVDRVVFAEAVGENIRGPLDPPKYHESTTAPGTVRTEDMARRPLEEALKSLDTSRLMRLLWFLTGRFENPDRLASLESDLTRLLARPQKSEVDRNLRLALVFVKVAQKDLRAAKPLLDELKKAYPDDTEIQKLTPMGLAMTVESWKQFDPARLKKRVPLHRLRPPEGEHPGERPPKPPGRE